MQGFVGVAPVRWWPTMRRLVVTLASLLLLSSSVASSPAHAAAGRTAKKKQTWVALVHTAGEVPATWAPRLQKAAEGVTDTRTWLPPPGLSLDDIQLTLGCATWGPTCAGQATSLIGADSALIIDIARDQHGIVVRIDGVDGKGAMIGNGERVEVSADDDGLAIAEAWVVGAIKGARPTVLVVTSDLDGTEVLIDNKRVGVTPLTLVNELAVGEHRLMLRRENRAPLTRPIVVQPGTVNREHGMLAQGPAMKAQPVVGEQPPAPIVAPAADGDAPPALAIAGFGLGGVGAVAAIGGLVGAAINFGQQSAIADDVDGTAHLKTGLCATGDGYASSSSSSCVTPLTDGGTGPDSRAAHEGEILDYVNGLRTNGSIALVIAGTGVLVAATGIALGVASLPGEDADASVQPAPAAAAR